MWCILLDWGSDAPISCHFGFQQTICNIFSQLADPKSFLSRPLRGAGTPVLITGDSCKNGREVNSTPRDLGMDIDLSDRDNHSNHYKQNMQLQY